MRFWYKIHPKKRGNWRPKIEFGFSILEEGLRHNPAFKAIYLVKRFPSEFDVNEDVVLVSLDSLKSDGEEWNLYDNENRRQMGVLHSTYKFNFGNLKVLENDYVSKDVMCGFSFYGPWKPGAKPDYREIVPVLFEIREWITIMLEDGLDSGENDEISGDMHYSPSGRWVGTGMETSGKEKNFVLDSKGRKRLVRRIEIGDLD